MPVLFLAVPVRVVVAAMIVVLFMQLLRRLKIMALAGKTQHTERKSDQEPFHHAPSITARRLNATKTSASFT